MRGSYAKLTPQQMRLARGIQSWSDLSAAQQRALSVLYLVQGSEWRGDRGDVVLGRTTRSERPWNMAVRSATARGLEELGLAETFLCDHEVRCRITDTGRSFVVAEKHGGKP